VGPDRAIVSLCLYDDGDMPASAHASLQRDEATGIWSTTLPEDLSGKYYSLSRGRVRAGTGVVRNRVTDPYSVSLSADSKRSYVADLEDPALAPDGWDSAERPAPLAAKSTWSIYELHVRDFSIGDQTVPARIAASTWPSPMRHAWHAPPACAARCRAHRHPPAAGVRHRDDPGIRLRDARSARRRGDSDAQQAAGDGRRRARLLQLGLRPVPLQRAGRQLRQRRGRWRRAHPRTPAHGDGAARGGLRVGMDVVYNHTSTAGQAERSVLDRVVPGYYQRLDANGTVERRPAARTPPPSTR
jgi:hypothetical protein